jgi:membrane protease YdiL (CAAX protease family)
MTATALRKTPTNGTVKRAIARNPIQAYVILAFAFSWSLTALLSVSITFGLLALFGPALAAFLVSWADGTSGELRDRINIRRESPSSYLAAFGIPFAVTGVALAAYVLLGHPAPGAGPISTLEILIFGLVIGEEIGWRGFLMPRLRARISLPAAGVFTGIVWALWHLPIYLAPDQGLAAFMVFAWWVVPFAVVMGFVTERARYSVIVATVMHGAANVAMPILLPNVDHTWTMVATGSVYVVLALTLVGYSRFRSAQPSARQIDQKEVAA